VKKAWNLRKSEYQTRGYALVVGYDASDNLPSLTAGVSDAMQMSKLLSEYEFYVTTLLNKEASKKNVQIVITEY
jgi:hypothetical protein